jgi:hypothetical protein
MQAIRVTASNAGLFTPTATTIAAAAANEMDRANALFLLRSAVSNLSFALQNLGNPVSRISEEARSHLSFNQRVALENSFSLRTTTLKTHLARLRTQLTQPDSRIFSNLNRIRYELEFVRNEYLKSEMVFGYYVDLLHTRGIMWMGPTLKGYDHLATLTLRLFLSPLGHTVPTVVVYLEQIGDGAAILRADISLWDRLRNPCAVIKVPQNTIWTPRSSVFHEAGHQIGSITGLNREGADLLYNTVRAAGGSTWLAEYWRFCATEIVADQVATQLTNWVGATTLYNIYSGSSGSSLGRGARMFMVIPRDTHLMGYLRLRSNIESCRLALGRGPWDQLQKALEILYPISLAPAWSARIITESLPILPMICRALARTKLACFGGKSFEEMYPMKSCSPGATRRVLNTDLSNFSVGMTGMLQDPILTLVAFGTIQMIGGKSIYWVTEEMRKWLMELGKREAGN